MNADPSLRNSESDKTHRGFWPAPASYWICQSLGWGIFLLLGLPLDYGILPVKDATLRGFLRPFVEAVSGILLTHLLRYLIRRQDWRSLPFGSLFRHSSLAALITGAAFLGVGVTFNRIADHLGFPPQPPDIPWPEWGLRLWDLASTTAMILIWQGIYFQAHVLRQHRREETERWKLEAALRRAELGTLKMQLNPRFLFNFFNSLRGLILDRPGRAQHAITGLASLLRYSLQFSSTATVSLAQEFQTVDDYLDLEALQFEERLRVRREIDPVTLRAQVPPMVVQTLIENAIKYGVSKNPAWGEIEITSRQKNGEVLVAITNKGRIEAQPSSTGLGLQNATDRLRRILGPSASISLTHSPNDVVTAIICLPLEQEISSLDGEQPTGGENSATGLVDLKTGRKRRGWWDAPASYWICQLIGWGFNPLLQIFAGLSGIDPLLARGILRPFAIAGCGILLTHLLREVIRQQNWSSFALRSLFARGALAALLIGAALLTANETFDVVANYFRIAPEPLIVSWGEWGTRLRALTTETGKILVWQAIYFQAHIIRQFRGAEAKRWKLESELASAELGALKAQLNPHFLFNCLNGLRALILEDSSRAQHLITRLSTFLRYSLQSASTPMVTLAEELQTVDDYLELEAIRFEERLRVRREIDPATLRVQVPPMVVQTLVENAIKYGVSKNPEPGEIEIISQRENGEVVVTITNNGRIESQPDSIGLGLQNAADRLHRLLGPSASITLIQSPNDLVTATLRVPLGIHTSVGRDSVESEGELDFAEARRPISTESRSTNKSR